AEAALGDAAVERHLAALEALDGHAGAGLLALDAAAGSLALARADAPAHAHAALAGAGIVGDFVQLHLPLPSGLIPAPGSRAAVIVPFPRRRAPDGAPC